jgi:hypothetical protein
MDSAVTRLPPFTFAARPLMLAASLDQGDSCHEIFPRAVVGLARSTRQRQCSEPTSGTSSKRSFATSRGPATAGT